MNINLNKIDPHVLYQFTQVQSDEGVWLIRFKIDKPASIVIREPEQDWSGNQSFTVKFGRECRDVEAIVYIERTSANYYSVIGIYAGKTKNKKFNNLEDVSNYIKLNFCKNLLG